MLLPNCAAALKYSTRHLWGCPLCCSRLFVQPPLRAEPTSFVLLDLCTPRKNTIVGVYSAQALHTRGSTAPAVKSGPFAVLCITSSFAFKHRQVTGAVGGSCSHLSSHFQSTFVEPLKYQFDECPMHAICSRTVLQMPAFQ